MERYEWFERKGDENGNRTWVLCVNTHAQPLELKPESKANIHFKYKPT